MPQYVRPEVKANEPGVGAPAIRPVATSITAFVGAAACGPISTPLMCSSFSEFEKKFGGLWSESEMAYAVRSFFLNGGTCAVIVRLFSFEARADNGCAKLSLGPLEFTAANPGAWGNYLVVQIQPSSAGENLNLAVHETGLTVNHFFDLLVEDTRTDQKESFQFVAVNPSAGQRRIDRVLEQGSQLIRLAKGKNGAPLPMTVSLDSTARGQGGHDGSGLTYLEYIGSQDRKGGIFALEHHGPFNLLCLPPDRRSGDIDPRVWRTAAQYCVTARAFLIVDPPSGAESVSPIKDFIRKVNFGNAAANVALYFPGLVQCDPLRYRQLDRFAPCGVVTGVIGRLDARRGVWKAPAGVDAVMQDVKGLAVKLSEDEESELSKCSVNFFKTIPSHGDHLWGARTLLGQGEFKYLSARRLALFLEKSIDQGLKWTLYEQTGERLWAKVRFAVENFLLTLFREGAFAGSKPEEAFFVRCDRQINQAKDILIVDVGFAALKPAEFTVLRIQQKVAANPREET
jgi:uncharacterized protein